MYKATYSAFDSADEIESNRNMQRLPSESRRWEVPDTQLLRHRRTYYRGVAETYR